MANTKWFKAFPSSETEFLETGESDHRPMVTYIAFKKEEPRHRFDARMSIKDGFHDTVRKRREWNGMGQTQLI